jgi:hypothetical protein
VLFFIKLKSRRVHLAGCTANPTGPWFTQQARQFAWTLPEQHSSSRFLIRDRDSKFTRDFDAIFRSEGIQIIKTPVQAPKANAFAERFVRTARTECLDRLLIINPPPRARAPRLHRPLQHAQAAPRVKPDGTSTGPGENVNPIPPPLAGIERRSPLADSFTSTTSQHEPTLRTPQVPVPSPLSLRDSCLPGAGAPAERVCRRPPGRLPSPACTGARYSSCRLASSALTGNHFVRRISTAAQITSSG